MHRNRVWRRTHCLFARNAQARAYCSLRVWYVPSQARHQRKQIDPLLWLFGFFALVCIGTLLNKLPTTKPQIKKSPLVIAPSQTLTIKPLEIGLVAPVPVWPTILTPKQERQAFITAISSLSANHAAAPTPAIAPGTASRQDYQHAASANVAPPWTPYAEYLMGDHWRAFRLVALDRAGHRCQVCAATGSLEVHHNSYDRKGREELTDVVVLCRRCHGNFHATEPPGLSKSPPRSSSPRPLSS